MACRFCSTQAVEEEFLGNLKINCPICGKYILSCDFDAKIFHNKYSSYLVYNNSNSIPVFGKNKEYFKVFEDLQSDESYKFVTEDDIEIFYPKTFTEKINKTLMWLENYSLEYGAFYTLESKKLEAVFLYTDIQKMEIR